MSICTFTIMLLLSTSLHAGEEGSQQELKHKVRAQVICAMFCEGSFKSGFRANRSDFNPYNQPEVSAPEQLQRCLRECNEAVEYVGASDVVQYSDHSDYVKSYPLIWLDYNFLAAIPESHRRDGLWWRAMRYFFSDALQRKHQPETPSEKRTPPLLGRSTHDITAYSPEYRHHLRMYGLG